MVTTYNVKEHLKITLAAIEQQDYPVIEVVIVDGQSKDGTLDVIRAFSKKYEKKTFVEEDMGQRGEKKGCATACVGEDTGHKDEDVENMSEKVLTVKWVSEPDNGLYDAMNKAWRMCSGDIVAVCNDRFCTPDAITKLVRAIERGGEDCVGSHADLVYVDGERIVRTWHMGEGRLRDGWLPGHPTLFLKRGVYEKYGVYDTRYKCAADYEFMVRFLKDEKNRLAYVPERLISMFYGGTSNAGLHNYWVSFREGYMALRRHGVRYPLMITLKRTLRVLRQF